MKQLDTPENWRFLVSEEQQSFVEGYCVTKSVAATADMVNMPVSRCRGFYSNPTVKLAIAHRQKEVRQNTQVDPESVLLDLAMVRDIGLGRIPAPETKWVDGVPVTKYVRQTNLPSAQKAIQDMGRSIAMFTDKKELVIPASDEKIQERLVEILQEAGAIDGDFEEIQDGEISQVVNKIGQVEAHNERQLKTQVIEDYDAAKEDRLAKEDHKERGRDSEPLSEEEVDLLDDLVDALNQQSSEAWDE